MSPPLTLHQKIKCTPKYGFLTASPCIIHPTHDFKSYISIDFKKYYANCLAKFTPFLGSPMHFKRINNEFKRTTTKIPHYTFANLLFSCLSKFVNGTMHFQLFGREHKITQQVPIDCLLLLPSPNLNEPYIKWILNFDGCFHHFCEKICHQPIIDNLHFSNCKACLNDKLKKSSHQPYLWKLKPYETMESFHPKKHVTYRQVNEHTKKIHSIIKSSSEVQKFIILKECEIIGLWHNTLQDVLNFYNLSPKPNINLSSTLATAFGETIMADFPLLNNTSQKITMQKIITNLRKEKIHGLLTVSGNFSEKTLKKLGHFPAFSFLDSNNKMVNSNILKNELISSQFLTFLLNNPHIEFVIKDIHELYLYPHWKEKPYHSAVVHILNLIQNHTENIQFTAFLKSISNFYIGSWSQSPFQYSNTFLMDKKTFWSLIHQKHFISSENLTNDYNLVKFHNKSAYINSSHNHLCLVQYGRAIFLKSIFNLMQHCSFEVASSNTDDAILVSNHSFLHKVTDPVFSFDQWLKPNLNKSEIDSYINIKTELFHFIGVCDNHLEDYKTHLMQNKQFDPKPCCKTKEKSHPVPSFTLKVESYGKFGMIVGKNRSLLFQLEDNYPRIRCSGMTNANAEKFLQNSPENAKQMFKQIVAFNQL